MDVDPHRLQRVNRSEHVLLSCGQQGHVIHPLQILIARLQLYLPPQTQ